MIICMEATGVYSEQLCYCLFKSKYRVAVEPPLRVKRAFKPQGHKTDPVDSIQIAEYALRLYDALNIWQPREEIVEKMKSLITARELLVTQRTATTNSITALKRKSVTPTKAIQILERQRKSLGRNIKALEDEMDHLLNP